MNVDPYKPKPSINNKLVPTRRFQFFSALKFTTGLRKVNSRHIKKKAPKKITTPRVVTTLLLNQSSSCAFRRIYCREPTKAVSNQMRGQSISPNVLVSEYFGLLTNCNVSNVAITPNGMLM